MTREKRTIAKVGWGIVGGLLLVLGTVEPAAAGEHRIGFGFHYYESLEDLEDDGFDIDDSGLVPVFSYQYRPPGLVFFEGNLVYYEDGYGGSTDTAYAPQVFVMVGYGLYGGVGVGVTFADDFDDNVSDPYYLARIGWSLKVLPHISLDLNLNYESGSFSTLDEVDGDSITLGAIARFSF